MIQDLILDMKVKIKRPSLLSMKKSMYLAVKDVHLLHY